MPVDTTGSRQAPREFVTPPEPQLPGGRPVHTEPATIGVSLDLPPLRMTIPSAEELASEAQQHPTDILALCAAQAREYVDATHRGAFGKNDICDAFLAGAKYVLSIELHRQQTAPRASREEVLKGTAKLRTILAALQLFRAQVLPEAKDEIASGEWLPAHELEQLIAEVEAAIAKNQEGITIS